DLLARAVGVGVRGVEEVDAELERPGNERSARVLRKSPGVGAPLRDAVAHAPEAQPGDLEAGFAEAHILHAFPPPGTRDSPRDPGWRNRRGVARSPLGLPRISDQLFPSPHGSMRSLWGPVSPLRHDS